MKTSAPGAEERKHRIGFDDQGAEGAGHRTAYWLVFLAMLLAAGAGLRFWQIGRLEMWLDECHTVVTAADPEGVLAALRRDTNAPLYFLLAKGWIALAGMEAAAVRSLSALLGVAQLAALAGWMMTLTGSRRVALWAAGLGAVTPIHIYYSQEARGYTLTWLLATLIGWTLTAALSSRSITRRGVGLWALHGAAVAAGLLTHDLMLAFIPACWLGAVVLRGRRAPWSALAAAHAAAVVVASPYLITILTQPKGAGTAWVAALWLATPPVLALPRSLEAFLIGGNLPDYLRAASPGGAVRLSAIALGLVLAAGVATAFLRRRPHSVKENDHAPVPGVRQQVGLLLLFLIMPLGLPWIYSLVKAPIYVVGRYDTLALPAFLALAGLGAGWVQRALVRHRALLGETVPPLVVATLAINALAPRYRGPLLDPAVTHIQARRAEAIVRHREPGDRFVCMGQEALKIGYQMLRLGQPWSFRTFPPDTREHLGWFNPEEVAARGRDHLAAQADTVLDAPTGDRLWVVMDPFSGRPVAPGETSPPNPYALISEVFLDQARARGFSPLDTPPDLRGTGLRLYKSP